jgi:hypothetical protein
MQNTLIGLGIVGTLAFGATVPIVPSEEVNDFLSVEEIKSERIYLEQREAYYRATGMEQKYIDQAVYSRDSLEEKLVNKGFIKVKNEVEVVKPVKKETVLETIVSYDYGSLINTAYAYTFGKEDFETCTTGTLPCSFTSNPAGFGAFVKTVDTTSQVNGTNSLECAFTGEAACYLQQTLTSDDEYWFQFSGLIPSGFTFGASGYTGLTLVLDTGGSTQVIRFNIENYGTNRLTANSTTLGYTNTGIDIPEGTPFKLEFRVKVSATVGDIDVWLDNDTSGSPDFDSGANDNLGSTNIGYWNVGTTYNPDITGYSMFWDDAITDTAFIGAGAVEATSTVNSTVKGGVIIKGGVIMGGM